MGLYDMNRWPGSEKAGLRLGSRSAGDRSKRRMSELWLLWTSVAIGLVIGLAIVAILILT